MENKSDKVFTDISSELYREYEFPGGFKVRIDQPQQLSVSDHGHRVFDAAGVSHYVGLPKDGAFHLTWKAKEGQPNFVR